MCVADAYMIMKKRKTSKHIHHKQAWREKAKKRTVQRRGTTNLKHAKAAIALASFLKINDEASCLAGKPA